MVDISRLRNFSSEIYRKWDWWIYLAREISRARYIENGIGWYISLEKFLEQDTSKMGLMDISRSRNFSSKIYEKMKKSIYLAQEISRSRYIELGLVDISCSRNFSSEIYQKWDWLIYLAWEISWVRYIENGFGWYIVTAAEIVKYLAGKIAQITMTKMHTFW